MWYNTYCSVDKSLDDHHSYSIHLKFHTNIESRCDVNIKKCLQLYWTAHYTYMWKNYAL